MIFDEPTEIERRQMEEEEEVKVKKYPESHLGIGGWDTEVIKHVQWVDNLD